MTGPATYHRRAVLAALAFAGAAPFAGRAGAQDYAQDGAQAGTQAGRMRLAAIDWAMLETAAAIGHMPVAACELIRFRADAVAPDLPPGMTDLGLRGAPNFELLQLTRPDLILSSPFYTRHEQRLATIAPVLSLPFFERGTPAFPRAMAALALLADRLGDGAAGARAQAAAEAALTALSRRAAPFAGRPVMLLDFGDARHFRAFGADSLYGGVLVRLGLTNAWAEETRFSFNAPVPMDRLANIGDAWLVMTTDIPAEAADRIARSVLWNALPPVQAGRVLHLPSSNPFGGVPAALRFAGLLVAALEGAAA